tara:strand:- start:41 stop:775 length:735 start_codon:yes stop_codon:yes gene_type:complete
MIKFFRKIRQKLLSENKFSKYLIYAIGEIILVVIGILIALGINNWSEENKNLAISDDTLQLLQTEIKETKSRLEKELESTKNAQNISNKYIRGKYKIDSLKNNPFLIYIITNTGSNKIDLPILERELTSEGLINGEEDVITSLRKIKKYKTYYNESSEISREYWHNQVRPYFIKHKVIVYTNRDILENEKTKAITAIEKIFRDEEFRNISSFANSINTALSENVIQLLELLDITIKLIEEKLIK